MANKPTPKQMDVLNYMSKIIDYWKGTNDIESPTLQGDLDEELINLEFDLTNSEEVELTDKMNALLIFVRDNKDVKELKSRTITIEHDTDPLDMCNTVESILNDLKVKFDKEETESISFTYKF